MYNKGDLVRWVSDWHVYAATSLGDIHGEKPRYSYGIVIRYSKDKKTIVVYDNEISKQYTINLKLTDCIVLSGTGNEKKRN
tara:strand:+ start:2513 stop:2755 length:243 start_codon:yes stop_codon:yes gene_type:complete